MAINDLYDTTGVVVGQAAVLFAPVNTPLPPLSAISFSDPFSMSPWTAATVNGAVAPVTAFTITYTKGGSAQTTTSLSVSALTATQIQTAVAALSNVGAGNVVVGGTAASGWTIALSDAASGGVITVSGTGGTPTVTSPLWTPSGATDAGWTFGAAKTTSPVNIEEQSTQVGMNLNTQSVSISGALAEESAKTLALSLNGVITTVAASSGVPGYDEVNPTDTVLQYAVVMLSQQANGKPKITYAPSWTQLTNASVPFRRAGGNKRTYGVSFETSCKTSQIRNLFLNTAALP